MTMLNLGVKGLMIVNWRSQICALTYGYVIYADTAYGYGSGIRQLDRLLTCTRL